MRRAFLLVLFTAACAAQTATLPRLGVNISRSFAYTCPPTDSTCAPYVDYSAIPAYAYTDAQGQRTPFSNWVRDQALPALTSQGFRELRLFFSPGVDFTCGNCGYSGNTIGRPLLLTRGYPYVSGKSFGTAAEPRLQPWVYSNLKMFFQDCAAAGIEIDLVLQWDENYGNWTEPAAANLFVGYAALRDIWLNTVQALVDSGVSILQVEPYQEWQFFQTSVEHHPVSLDPTPGFIQSRIIPPGDWGNKARGQYAADVMDATLGQMQTKFPQIAGRIFPGLELRSESAGACNSGTFNGWGDGPWSLTDVASYYAYVASRNLVFPWLINMHRYVGLDLNGNPTETADQVRQVFDDLYAYHAGDASAFVTKCSTQPASPAMFVAALLVVLGETNSDHVIDWTLLNTMTNGYTASRLSRWEGGGYRQTFLMPWFFGYNLDPWDPQTAAGSIHP